MAAKSKKMVTAPKIWIFIAIYILLSLFLFDPKLFTGGDNAVYIMLGESIASGKGYRNIYLPGEPSHTQYPFGFPLLLAPFITVFGRNIIVLKIVILLCGVGALFFTHRIFSHFFKEHVNLVMAFYLSIPILVIYNHWILSEMPFLFFSLGAIFFVLRHQQQKNLSSFFLASLFSIYAFFIRTAGFSLIIAFFLSLLVNKQYKHCAIFSALCIACIVPWIVRNARVPDNTSYIAQLLAKNPYKMEAGKANPADFATRIWQNLTLYIGDIIPAILVPAVRNAWILAIVGCTFFGLAVVGFLRRVKEFAYLNMYTVLSVAILIIWPRIWSTDRFFLPLLPVFVIYFFIAVIWLGQKMNQKHFVKTLVFIVLAVNAFHFITEAKIAVTNNIAYLKGDRYAGYSIVWRTYFEMIEWIRENIPKDKIILARKPEFVYFCSGHKSFCYPFSRDTQKIKDAIAASDYVFLDTFQTTGLYLYPVIEENLSDYELVQMTEKPEFYLLKVIK